MYKHYYMKQYNCVFCAFPLLSVCLTSFAQILTTNENWILFLAFLKIMWTIFGCKWHFPSRDTTYDIEHDKKECQERRNWSRRIKVSQEDGQNWSCGSISVFVCIFWTNDLICIIVKTWENISSLSLSLNVQPICCSIIFISKNKYINRAWIGWQCQGRFSLNPLELEDGDGGLGT